VATSRWHEALRHEGDAAAAPHGGCYWVLPGRFLAGSHPAVHLDILLAAGVDSFVDLTCPQEPIAPYALAARGRARWRGFAITDYSVPGARLMREIVAHIDGELAAGATLYLHCHAGVGRTGTALGCWLVEQGLSGAEALALIARKRHTLAHLAASPRSPETDAQREFVLRWVPRGPMP
jgi:atypical dual specificity phosphatase